MGRPPVRQGCPTALTGAGLSAVSPTIPPGEICWGMPLLSLPQKTKAQTHSITQHEQLINAFQKKQSPGVLPELD